MARKKYKPVDRTPIDLVISGLTHEGRGLSQLEGKKVFVHGALPLETVRCERTLFHSRYEEAKALEVVADPSPSRVVARCSHFDICGGCSLQHLSHEGQLEHKQSSLVSQLTHEKVVPLEVLAPVRGPEWHYRHKARLGVRFIEKKGVLAVGFRERGTNKLALMNECPVLHERLEALIEPLKALISSLSVMKSIAQVEVAMGQVPALVMRHMEPLCDDDNELLKQFAMKHDSWMFTQSGGPSTVVKLYPEDGQDKLLYELPAFNIKYEFHPLDFTQINPVVNQQMVQLALDALEITPEDTVLDLFSGLGNFSLPIARRAKKVIGVEGSLAMTERAAENAALNGLTNTEFFAANLALDCSSKPWAGEADKVLIDPPRSGAWEVLEWVAKLKPSVIVYVSCNPATLARDAGRLVNELGYKCKSVRILDMFPHTAHVESLAVFVRGR